MNHLEQFVAEWYEYQGYFVRRNVWVGKRAKGGYECELDIIAFHPTEKRLIQIEPSMDANPWAVRERRYQKKFKAGKKYIPEIFKGLDIPTEIEQIALLGFASTKNRKTLAGGKIMTVDELLGEVFKVIGDVSIFSKAIPEQFPILRTLQWVVQHKTVVKDVLFGEEV